MHVTKKFKTILVLSFVLVVFFSYLINRFVGRQEPTSPVDSLYYSDQDKIDSYNKSKRDEALRKKAQADKKPKSTNRTINKDYGRQLTIDGWDPASKSVIDPLNLWKDYQSRTYAGKVRHGEIVTLVKREGDGVLIETKSGLRGWITYFFIKEYNESN